MLKKSVLLVTLLLLPSLVSAKTSLTRAHGEEGDDNQVFAMDALDDNNVWFLGAVSVNGNTEIRGYRMTNGSSFSQTTLPAGSGTMVRFTDIAFMDTQVGFVAGMDVSLPFKLDFATNVLWRTTNGGGSWEVVDDSLEEMIVKLDLFPTGELFVITDKSFYSLSGALVKGGTISVGDLSLNNLHMISPQVGFVVGGQGLDEENPSQVPGRGFIFKTTDGGTSFVPLAQELPFNVTAVWFINEDIGYIAGDDGTRAYLRVTVDGGQTWSDQSLPYHTELTIDIELPFKFSQTIEASQPTSLSAIRFFDCERGVALGLVCTGSCDAPADASYLTVFMRTYDGGLTWEMDPDYEGVMDGWGQLSAMPKVVSGMHAMAFTTPNHGFIAGQQLMVLMYNADEPESVPEPGIPDCSGGTNTNNGTNNGTNNDNGFNEGGESSGCGCAHVGGTGSSSRLGFFFLALFALFVVRRRI